MNGVLGPDQRVNVSVEFLPQDGRSYGMKLSVRVGASNNNIKVTKRADSEIRYVLGTCLGINHYTYWTPSYELG